MYEHGEQEMSDEEFAGNVIVGSDPVEHVERIRELEELGATVIVLQNNSGVDPLRAIEVYGAAVLPALAARASSVRSTHGRLPSSRVATQRLLEARPASSPSSASRTATWCAAEP